MFSDILPASSNLENQKTCPEPIYPERSRMGGNLNQNNK
jgi:hypothetical protein